MLVRRCSCELSGRELQRKIKKSQILRAAKDLGLESTKPHGLIDPIETDATIY
jgi:hypothetical protein